MLTRESEIFLYIKKGQAENNASLSKTGIFMSYKTVEQSVDSSGGWWKELWEYGLIVMAGMEQSQTFVFHSIYSITMSPYAFKQQLFAVFVESL